MLEKSLNDEINKKEDNENKFNTLMKQVEIMLNFESNENNNIKIHKVIVKDRNSCDPTTCCIKFTITLIVLIFYFPRKVSFKFLILFLGNFNWNFLILFCSFKNSSYYIYIILWIQYINRV